MVSFSNATPAQRTTPDAGGTMSQFRTTIRALAGGARFVGVVLMLAAVGMWILSGPLWDAEMMLVRLAISVLFMCLGLMLLHAGRDGLRDEIHLDQTAHELRHVQRGRDGIARVVRRLPLADLGGASIAQDTLTLRCKAGEIVMEVSGLAQDTLSTLDRRLNAR